MKRWIPSAITWKRILRITATKRYMCPLHGTGVDGSNITNSNVRHRLMNACGGYLSRYGSYSTAQISAAARLYVRRQRRQ